jgi:hypothetical protein
VPGPLPCDRIYGNCVSQSIYHDVKAKKVLKHSRLMLLRLASFLMLSPRTFHLIDRFHGDYVFVVIPHPERVRLFH